MTKNKKNKYIKSQGENVMEDNINEGNVSEEQFIYEEPVEEPVEVEEQPYTEPEPEPEAGPEPSKSIETEPTNEVQFQWDGVVCEGLFAQLASAGLSEAEEEMWVKKFAEKGLAFRTTFVPFRLDEEVVVKGGRDPEDTWIQYKQIKKYLLDK